MAQQALKLGRINILNPDPDPALTLAQAIAALQTTLETTTWTCRCSARNGVNLDACGVCRAPRSDSTPLIKRQALHPGGLNG